MFPKEQDIEIFKILSPMLNSIFIEMKEFSKKVPNDKLNELKVKMINRILVEIKNLLNTEPSILFLDLLDDDTLPSNSDTVLILTQHKTALENFRTSYFYSDDAYADNRWHTEENP